MDSRGKYNEQKFPGVSTKGQRGHSISSEEKMLLENITLFTGVPSDILFGVLIENDLSQRSALHTKQEPHLMHRE